MRLQLHLKSLLAFLILMLLLHEAHEFSHHITAMACGNGCIRDFLVWDQCIADNSRIKIIATIAGPFITFCFMWAGFVLLKPSNTAEKKCIGFALVMASLPLTRLLAAANRGGDEITIMRMIFHQQESMKKMAVAIGGLIVLLLTLPPLWRAFKAIQNKQRIIIFLAFLVLPWLIDTAIVAKLLNGVLVPSGILMKPVYAGTPLLVIVWEILLVVSFLLMRKQLLNLKSKI